MYVCMSIVTQLHAPFLTQMHADHHTPWLTVLRPSHLRSQINILIHTREH